MNGREQGASAGNKKYDERERKKNKIMKERDGKEQGGTADKENDRQ